MRDYSQNKATCSKYGIEYFNRTNIIGDSNILKKNEDTKKNDEKAMNEALALIRNLKNEDNSVRKSAIFALAKAFPYAPDKELGTTELLGLTEDDDENIRRLTASTLGEVFAHITQKDKGTNVLISLTEDENIIVRRTAIRALSSAFKHLTDKEKVIKHLLGLTKNELLGCYSEDALRNIVLYTSIELRSPKVLDMEQILNYLLEFTKHESSFNLCGTVDAPCSRNIQFVDSNQEWKTVLALLKDDTTNGIPDGFYVAFARFPDKESALKDLLALIKYPNSENIRKTTLALNEILTPMYIRNTVIDDECNKCGYVTKHIVKDGPNDIEYKCDKCGHIISKMIDILS